MGWKKLGLIFDLSKHNIQWLKSHAMVPTPLLLADRIRIYFSGRDQKGQSRISYIDLDRNDPAKVIYIHDRPLMEVGKIGTFDDSGTIATCATVNNSVIYLYYTAYSLSVTVPYRNSIGIASSIDNGKTFNRLFKGPIVDRSINEPYFTISPWVLQIGGIWHMWYASATDWLIVNGKPESIYHIKYAYSTDGIKWHRDNQSCILPITEEEANARPSVIQDGEKLKMWFCYRGSTDFRDGNDSYKIGYAEAHINKPTSWTRKDNLAGINCGPEQWDNQMQAYPAVLNTGKQKFLFYNGNGFGINGFCCAKWE
jgi:hypothetical protein